MPATIFTQFEATRLYRLLKILKEGVIDHHKGPSLLSFIASGEFTWNIHGELSVSCEELGKIHPPYALSAGQNSKLLVNFDVMSLFIRALIGRL
jgi:hypothetical protein